MELFAVFQEGVYRHGCHGIFERTAEAIAHANHLANTDQDDYHEYTVVPFTLGAALGRVWDMTCGATEQPPIHRVKKTV